MTYTKKADLKKITNQSLLWTDGRTWTGHEGELRRGPGHPGSVQSLFKLVAEKLPYESLEAVAGHLKENGWELNGVYIAHDSMGCARYVGRGNVIERLRIRKNANPLELKYFSFYLVKDRKHEREIETVLIRAAGPMLHFNDRKKRVDIRPGNIKDYEAGTRYFERHKKKGRRRFSN
jgi:hypothetical protein